MVRRSEHSVMNTQQIGNLNVHTRALPPLKSIRIDTIASYAAIHAISAWNCRQVPREGWTVHYGSATTRTW